MLTLVSPSQPDLEKTELRKLAQTVLDQIKKGSVNSVLNTTIEQVRRLAGTEIGKDLIQIMNAIAEKEAGGDTPEQALIDRFRNVLGGQ